MRCLCAADAAWAAARCGDFVLLLMWCLCAAAADDVACAAVGVFVLLLMPLALPLMCRALLFFSESVPGGGGTGCARTLVCGQTTPDDCSGRHG